MTNRKTVVLLKGLPASGKAQPRLPDAPNAIIVDLDGTLCNVDHRRHFVAAKQKNWMAFYGAIKDDGLNEWCDVLMDAMAPTHQRILCSGRPEQCRRETELWLGIHGVHYDLLLMRPDFLPDGKPDYRQDSIVKQEIYERHIKGKYNVTFVVDDRKQVVDMWRRNGLTVLQCDDGDF